MGAVMIVGDPGRFAIEYRCEEASPPYGGCRLFIEGRYLGSVQYSMYIYHLSQVLRSIASGDNSCARIAFQVASEVPPFDQLLSRGNWSFGECFDDFLFVYFIVKTNATLHFVWELDSSKIAEYPDYPSGRHHCHVGLNFFGDVVNEFLERLNDPALSENR